MPEVDEYVDEYAMAPAESVVRIDDDDIELHNMDTIDLTGLYHDEELAETGRPASRVLTAATLIDGPFDRAVPCPTGLWRSPVAHLVRIEGVRGSNPLSSTNLIMVGSRLRRSPTVALRRAR